MKVVYTPRARDDLDAIFRYLNDRSPVAAVSVLRTIRNRIAKLADFPLMAPVTEMADIRGLTVLRYPYKAYYRVEGDEILILHVRDARRASWQGAN